MSGIGILAAVLGSAAALPPLIARAEVGDELLVDDFSELDASLGAPGQYLGVKDNVLTYNLEKGFYWRTFYDALLFDDADATLKVRLPDWSGESGAAIGLVFWGRDLSDFYVLQLSDAGTYSVAHATNNWWYKPVSWRSSDAVNAEPGAWNELRVVTSGRRATIFVNGKELASVKGQTPPGGSLFGFYCSAGSADVVGEFTNLRILEGPAPAADDPMNDPNVLLSDDFGLLDASWGTERPWFGVKDKRLFIQFEPFQRYETLYEGLGFTDADASVKLQSVSTEPDDRTLSGIIFWAKDYDEYYRARVAANGMVDVVRRVNGEWKTAMAARPIPDEAKFNPEGWTELRVVTIGKKATVFINGVKAAVMHGQPPSGEWKLGLTGESGAAASESHFSDLVVRRPQAEAAEPQ